MIFVVIISKKQGKSPLKCQMVSDNGITPARPGDGEEITALCLAQGSASLQAPTDTLCDPLKFRRSLLGSRMTGEEIDQNICEAQPFIMQDKKRKKKEKRCSLNEAVTFYRQGSARFPLRQESLAPGLCRGHCLQRGR